MDNNKKEENKVLRRMLEDNIVELLYNILLRVAIKFVMKINERFK